MPADRSAIMSDNRRTHECSGAADRVSGKRIPMTTTALHPVPPSAKPTSAKLNELSPPIDIVRFLQRTVRLTQKEIAHIVGADERTVRRWLSPDAVGEPQRRLAQRIDDVRDLVTLLADTLPGEQTARWMRSRNRLLDGERPIELLARGQYQQVSEVAHAYADGDPL
jgi:Protein of unknown function (DUF2384)